MTEQGADREAAGPADVLAEAIRARSDLERFFALSRDMLCVADFTRGSGLRGLGDRIGALGRRLVIDSREGRGTTLRAAIPIDR
jgi:hypothetical protein